MSSKPTKATVAGRVYLELRRLALAEGRTTDELHQLYALEGFLVRLAASKYRSRLVLKGGALLAAYDVRRATRDLDFQARRFSGAPGSVLTAVRAIAAVPRSDGLAFGDREATARPIREDDEYQGVRVMLPCTLASARVGFGIDVNVGDPIWPSPEPVTLSRLLGGTIVLSGYPLHMVHAEKIVTAFQRGTASTRWRDFADLYLLSGRHSVSGDNLGRAIAEVAGFRRAPKVSLATALDGYSTVGEARWVFWRRAARLEARLPASFGEVLAAVMAFADPVIEARVAGKAWDPATRSWG